MPATRPHWPLLLAIALAGLMLRVLSAQGGLWLDEAWSAVFARDVGTPIAVLTGIHHDNNHVLNTLWMQMMGFGAHPIVQRGLSILCGTATIVVAGLFGWRCGAVAGVATATLFALSPLMVTYGSEARGYAPMLLAFVGAAAIVDCWQLYDRPPRGLVAVAVLGMMAQMTMAFGLAAIGVWAVARVGIARAARTLALPAVAAILVGVVLVGVPVVRGWFTFGNLEPFDHARFAQSLGDLYGYTLGLPAHVATAAAIGLATLCALPFVRDRAPFYAAAILGLPLLMAVLQPMNGAIARYYLPSAAALLLLAGDVAGVLWARNRVAVLLIAAVLLAGVGWRDGALLANLRADPLAAIDAMAARVPAASASIEMDRSSAILESAAAVRRYPLTIAPCARFLFVERDGDTPFAPAPVLCGRTYRAIAEAHPTGLSGTHWTLYEIAR